MKPVKSELYTTRPPISWRINIPPFSEHATADLYSPSSNASSKLHHAYPIQDYDSIRHERELIRSKYFLGGGIRHKQLPYTNKINFISRSHSKAKQKNNLSDYLATTIRHRLNNTSRRKYNDHPKSFKELMEKNGRLLQICTDIEKLHEISKIDFGRSKPEELQYLRNGCSPVESELPSICQKMQQRARETPLKNRVKEPSSLPIRRTTEFTKSYFQRREGAIADTFRTRPIKTDAVAVGPWEIAD